MDPCTFLNAGNLEFLEEMYQVFLKNPDQLDPSWHEFFARDVDPFSGDGISGPTVRALSIFNTGGSYTGAVPDPGGTRSAGAALEMAVKLSRVHQMVNMYRVRGHLMADLDPLDVRPVPAHPELEPSHYGFQGADLDLEVPNGGFQCGQATLSLRSLLGALRETYCRNIGVEYMNIQDHVQRAWLQERMEPVRNRFQLTRDQQIRILEKLSAAEGLETFLHTKFVGTKRFSLEGGESLIPMLDLVIEHAASQGVVEVVMGMPHRGRLNVLTNILGQEPSRLFAQFEDIDPMATLGSGDVKYHLGYSNDLITRTGHRVHLTLTSNPSHLEAVNPVVEGRTRAKQDRVGDTDRTRVMALILHGDAAFAGQGLVSETLNLAQLPGYRTGGTVHVVVNNQIGFTTAPSSSRSTPYSTDVAKMMQIPIFHVNGEDPEAVAQVVRVAIDFRREFKKDVVIDMFCFRKYGHNESDEPSFTQPLMYRAIERHPSVHRCYTDRMVQTGTLTQEEADAIVLRVREALERDLEHIRSEPSPARASTLTGLWSAYQGGADAAVPDVNTQVSQDMIRSISERLATYPEGFTPHRKIQRVLAQRGAMGRGEADLDWGMGEALAFGSLLWEGVSVRLSGQDSRRGTFSQRHAVIVDVNNGDEHVPLARLRGGQGAFNAIDSSLSEAGVMGFDYGYSLDAPDSLVMWEAQFGDFVNGAQIVIDQFITSGEDKWKRLSGLVLLLPHGHEGQGPEHSSARLERFLQACARDNIQVCNASTPAQYFHLLRRQVLRPIRKPLVLMTPKSLLRHPLATSPVGDLSEGRFHRVLTEDSLVDPVETSRVFLCSGKVAVDLIEERRQRGATVPILRLEQLYPFPESDLLSALGRYPALKEVRWVQEEPRNMGALEFVRPRLADLLGDRVRISFFSRGPGASPATGSAKASAIEQRRLMDEAFSF